MKKEVIEKLAVLITSAFGFAAALAWNDVIKALFTNLFGEASHLPALLSYAAMVTILAVFVTVELGKLSQKK